MTTKTTVETSQRAIRARKSRWTTNGRSPRMGEAPSPLPSPRVGEREGQGRCYARRNLKLKRRISNCWFGFGVHSTYFCKP